MFADLDSQARQMLIGNILMVVCCLFYIAWWALALHPTHPISGFTSGWLLIPAAIFGLAGAVLIVMGSSNAEISMPIPRVAIVAGGVVLYILLLVGTSLLLHRQVTTELLLIVVWLVVMFLEVCALQGLGLFSTPALVILLIITVLVAAGSLVCYLLYYGLAPLPGYIDGMLPLILIGLMMVAMSIAIPVSARL
ncbi:MAG: hypothetical protein LUD25_01190 [Coriobacteriaceae bacterium]|nr:hypothetical protein [Coriobacteriaceae bacterium]